jgi:ParB family chromosome partitioning protein
MVLDKGKSSKKSGLGKRPDRNNEKSRSGQNKATALLYAAEGLHVVPLHGKKKDGGCTCGNPACAEPGMHPRTKNGIQDATTDAGLIDKRWTKWPKAKIGIATGADVGIVAVVAKGEAGRATMRGFGDQNKAPRTVTFYGDNEERTYLFRVHGVHLRDRLEDVAEGITVVGDDDFVLAPSQAEDWVEGRAIGEVDIAEVPKGLLDLITTEPGKAVSQTLERIAVDDVEVVGKHREVDPEKVKTLAASMAKFGLHTPITVRRIKKADGTKVLALVAGGHRLAAAKYLGWTHIDAFVMEGNETDARIRRLMENLYRADLTALQRAEDVAELVQLVLENAKGVRLAPRGGPQPHDRGIKKAAKALGLTREEIRRSLQIAGISAEAKAKAKKLGLDKMQSALLKIAKQEGSAAQVAKIDEIKEGSHPVIASSGALAKKAKKHPNGGKPSELEAFDAKAGSSPPTVPEDEDPNPEPEYPELPASLDRQRDENERLFASLKAAWDNAPRSVRKRFVTEVLHANIEV